MPPVLPFPFSSPKAPQPRGQLTPVPAHARAGASRKFSPASCPQGIGVCAHPLPGGDLPPCSAKARGQPAASRPRELRSAKRGSSFWRAASLRAEEAEPGCTDRKKEKPRCFKCKTRFPSLPPGRTGDILAKIREDCNTLRQEGSR